MWIALLAAGPVLDAQALSPVAFARDVPVSVAEGQEWSWFGLPAGRGEAWGVAFEMPAAEGEEARAAAETVTLEPPAQLVYALVSPVVELHLASVDFERTDGTRVTVRAEDCALAWAAEAPRRRRLLLARCEGPVARVTPNGCYLFALAVGDAVAAGEGALRAAYAQGQAEWRGRFREEAPAVVRLQEVAARIPEGRVAVLPPRGAEPAALTMVLGRTGMRQKLVELEGADLLDAQRFAAARFPVALYVGMEAHLRTIRAENDAAEAVLRYVREGGAILMATAWPFPTYYALDAGSPGGIPNQPLLRRMGVDIVAAFERPPEGAKLSLHPVAGQTLLPSLQGPWPFPETGDLRLRSFGATSEAAKATPLVEVRTEDGRPVGPAAALFEFEGGGCVLYVWSGIMNDGRVADGVAGDLLQWMAAKLEGVADAD
ncbi:MAG: hypothetical protein FJX74_22015 [Armatimonadetes bacterium]|nr:hypothetical protein [Armatimonadota bacterium]